MENDQQDGIPETQGRVAETEELGCELEEESVGKSIWGMGRRMWKGVGDCRGAGEVELGEVEGGRLEVGLRGGRRDEVGEERLGGGEEGVLGIVEEGGK